MHGPPTTQMVTQSPLSANVVWSIGKPRMILYTVTKGTLYDSVVLTEDTGVIRSLLIDDNQWKAEKNWT